VRKREKEREREREGSWLWCLISLDSGKWCALWVYIISLSSLTLFHGHRPRWQRTKSFPLRFERFSLPCRAIELPCLVLSDISTVDFHHPMLFCHVVRV